MKKILSMLILVVCTICLTGCTTYKSYTFKVSTGDQVEVKLNTNDGYDLNSELPIVFKKGDKEVGQGSFFKEEAYDLYYQEMNKSNATIIKEKKDNYFFYRYDGDGHVEYDYIIKIKDSKTVFILATTNEQKDAEELFNRLEFILVK